MTWRQRSNFCMATGNHCFPCISSSEAVEEKSPNTRNPAKLGVGLLIILTLASICIGCATPAAVLVLSAPPSVIAGCPFSVTVKAEADGSPDKIFNSPVLFTSSDPAATLPAIYTFTATDAGSHTFTNGIILITSGNQSVTATDPYALTITASATISVSAATQVCQ